MSTTPGYCEACQTHNGMHTGTCPVLLANAGASRTAITVMKPAPKPMTELQLRRIVNAEQCNTEATRRYALQYAVQLLGYKPGDAVDMRRAIQTASLIYEWEARGIVPSADAAGLRPASTLQ